MLKHTKKNKIKKKIPVTPPMESSISGLVEEYENSPMPPRPAHVYCPQLSESQYQQQASTETEKALKDLVDMLEKNPELYKQLLKKRKQERMEKSGIFSYIKVKFLQFVQGAKYKGAEVTDSECLINLYSLKAGMFEAFEYAQEFRNLQKKRDKKSLSSDQVENRLSLLTSTPRFQPVLKQTESSSTLIKNSTPMKMPAPLKLNYSVLHEESTICGQPPKYKPSNLTRPPLRDCNRIPPTEKRQNKRVLPSLAPVCKKTKLNDSQMIESCQENHVTFKVPAKYSYRSPGSTPFKRSSSRNRNQDSFMTFKSLNLSLEASLCQAFGEIIERESIRIKKPVVNDTECVPVDNTGSKEVGQASSSNTNSDMNVPSSESGTSNRVVTDESSVCSNSSIASAAFKSKFSFRDHLSLGNPVDSSFYQFSGSDSTISYTELQV